MLRRGASWAEHRCPGGGASRLEKDKQSFCLWQPCPGVQRAWRRADALGCCVPGSVLKGLKREAAQRISKSLSSGSVTFHAQFLSFSLPPAALKVDWSRGEMVTDEEQEGPSRPSCPRTCFWLGKPSHTDFFSLPFPAGAEALHCKRPCSFPLCLGGGGLKSIRILDICVPQTHRRPAPSISLLLCQKLANSFSLKNCPEPGNLGLGRRRAGELGASWTLPNELLAQVRGREIIFLEDNVVTS